MDGWPGNALDWILECRAARDGLGRGGYRSRMELDVDAPTLAAPGQPCGRCPDWPSACSSSSSSPGRRHSLQPSGSEGWHQPLVTADCAAAVSRVLHDGERLQSLLCLIPTVLTAALGAYIRSGGKSVKEWHAMHDAAIISVSESQRAFANINTQAELDAL